MGKVIRHSWIFIAGASQLFICILQLDLLSVEYPPILWYPTAGNENEDTRVSNKSCIPPLPPTPQKNSSIYLNSVRKQTACFPKSCRAFTQQACKLAAHVLGPFCFSSFLIKCMTRQKFAELKPSVSWKPVTNSYHNSLSLTLQFGSVLNECISSSKRHLHLHTGASLRP